MVGFCQAHAKIVSKYLTAQGFRFEIANSVDEAEFLLESAPCQTLLVSDRIEGELPLEFIFQMKRRCPTVPIILVSDAVRPAERVEAFELGADDCVSISTNPAELAARIYNAARRFHAFSSQVIEAGSLKVRLGTRKVAIGKLDLDLPNKEYRIIELLALKKGQTVSREALIQHLYEGDDEPENASKILSIMICRIRRKIDAALGDGRRQGELIVRTVRMNGYLLQDPESHMARAA